jgi:2-dehydro-3-deoxy-D-arabinonate dehydratase
MQLYKKDNHCWLVFNGKVFTHAAHWDQLVNRAGLYEYLTRELQHWSQVDFIPDLDFDAPIHGQEIWAAGVTYLRSKQARMDEAKDAGGGNFYDRVYAAERPEIFFKSQPYRTSGPGGPIRIRKDSAWNVPEPELTLFVSSKGTIEGYTIGNDVSSRSIEGENPLYLPQAKTYDQSASIGPCLYIPGKSIDPSSMISMKIDRSGTSVFDQSIGIDQMKRTHEELVSWLFRSLHFPQGVFLMTGTGMVPPDSFTLLPEDEVHISITGIGTLINKVIL